MFLACDVGNSNVKLAVYNNTYRSFFKIVPTGKINLSFLNDLNITSAAISSVVPQKTEELVKYLQNEFCFDPYIINIKSKFNLLINYKTPETLGIDRICSAEGALNLYRNDNPEVTDINKTFLLILDFGTATTINFVNHTAVFEGGIILPGIKLMINSLSINTAQLPKIELTDYTSFIGRDTRSSIASGVLNSTLSLLEKVYNHLTNVLGIDSIKIYITGGNASAIQPFIKYENVLVDDLVLRGVKAVYERNQIAK
jgi:type III pantothenate kinase